MKSKEFRRLARENLNGRWGNFALITFLYMLFVWLIGMASNSIPIIGPIAIYIISPVMSFGFINQMILLKNGVNVILTREGDYDLSSPNALRRKKSDFDNRIKLINDSDANMYISIHINYLDASKYYGAQVFYTKNNEDIAKSIQESLVNNLKSPLDYKKLSDDIYMYKKLNVPGVLVECGFLSNYNERILLQKDDYQLKIAGAIIDGIINYY
jgi:N-acetylmuramoyl-L-alanine amidase